MKIEVYSDGSATVKTKPGGYGYVIVIDGVKVSEGNGHMNTATNNDAELEAALQGLAAVLKMRIDGKIPIGAHEVILVSDSQIVLGWVDGTYRFKQREKRHKYDQLCHVVKKLQVKTRWVQGHSGDTHNERCDRLANEGRKMYDQPKLKPVKAAKEEKQKYKWNETRKTEGFTYNPNTNLEVPFEKNISDKEIIKNPEQFGRENVAEVICRVLRELIELQEKK